jgi:hypothetical protein
MSSSLDRPGQARVGRLRGSWVVGLGHPVKQMITQARNAMIAGTTITMAVYLIAA